MLYGTEFSCDIRAKLSDLMAHIFPGDINTFFYTAGGAEANEAAIRMARVMTGRTKVIARYRSYHGSMGMTMQLTGDSRRWFGEPGIPGVVHMHDPWPYSFTWGENEEEITQRNLAYFRETIEHEGPNKIAAIIMESVTGTNGILAPPKGYLEGIRGICDEYGIVMICDEVMAGFGRTGKLFGFMHTTPTILPDIVTMAKGINGAVLPLGAVAVRDHVRDFFHSNQIGTGTTYNAHPTVLASAYASIKQFLSQDLTGRAEKMQPIIRAHMARMADKHKCIKQCRNIGMFGIMELQKNAKGELFASPTAAHATTAKLKKALMSRGLFTFVKMNQFFVNPPLIITEQELAEAFDIIDEALTEMDEDFEDEE